MIPPIARNTIALCFAGFVLVAQDVYRELKRYKNIKPK
jgi:hypothetical protein